MIFAGLKKPQERAHLIAYIEKRHKSAPSEVPTTCNGPSIDTNKSDQIKETTPDLHMSTNDIGFVKQSTRKNRLFQLNWLNRYDGPVYSPSKEGAYCIYCALCGVDNLGTLSCKPLTDMAHASTRLNDHFGRDEKSCKKSHAEARAKAQLFLDNIEQRTTDIQTFID
ncbi:CYC [Mytilus coruscus]|uniref:CYC n=1 Tax=Mytilus coruscus TaxID=42192 RepID=A0A6J8E1M6_MYTCO|nr:CYC [Mytilus coruscus]